MVGFRNASRRRSIQRLRLLQAADLGKVGGVEFAGNRAIRFQHAVARACDPVQVVGANGAVIEDDAADDASRVTRGQAA